jgi:acetylornithine deacetylase
MSGVGTDLAAAIDECLATAPDRAARLLVEMVAARSVNPWFGPADGDAREARMQALLRPRLEALGAEIDEWEPDAAALARHEGFPGYHPGRDFRGRPNLVGRIPGKGDGRSLLLLGHADTVSVDPDWSLDPFAGTRRDGMLIGRGSVDMKGGMAAALAALELLAEVGVELAGDVLYASVVDEEAGGMGTLAFVDRGHRADAAIIPEPTDLSIAPLCRGVLWCKVTIPGRTGHIEIPQPDWRRGGAVDAIGLGRDLLGAVDELNRRWATDPRKNHPLLPGPCQAIPSVIAAGSVPSSWAGEMSVSFDIQYLPAERDERGLGTEVRAEFEAFVGEWAARHPWLGQHPPAIEWPVDADCAEIPADHPLVTTLGAAAEAVGIEPAVRGIPFHTDMGMLVNAGIPTVNFGPGDPAIAHQPDEAIAEDSLDAAVRAFALAIAGWCGTGA